MGINHLLNGMILQVWTTNVTPLKNIESFAFAYFSLSPWTYKVSDLFRTNPSTNCPTTSKIQATWISKKCIPPKKTNEQTIETIHIAGQ